MSNENNNTNKSQYLTSAIEGIESQYKLKKYYAGISTGIEALDKLCGGLAPETLWVIAGRPSSAKTSLAMKMISTGLTIEKKKVAVFTSDHTPKEFLSRLIASRADMATSELHTGRIQDNHWPKLIQSAATIVEENLDLFPNTWISIQDIKTAAAKGSYDLIVIDKFHSLILKEEAQEGANNRINELNQSAIELKGIAKDHNAVVVLICDTNKGQAERADSRPMLKDLKDMGGVLESYADVVIGTHIPNEESYVGHNIPVKIEALALKNRFGPQLVMHLSFNRSSQQISDWTPPSSSLERK